MGKTNNKLIQVVDTHFLGQSCSKDTTRGIADDVEKVDVRF